MIECSELAGKVIRQCTLFEDGSDGPDLQIDFTDGTSFSVNVKAAVTVEAKCLKQEGAGEPQVLKDYTALITPR